MQDEETDSTEHEITDENEKAKNNENEEDEPIEDLIAEYRDLYKKFEDKKI